MPSDKQISLDEVKNHNKPDDLWVVVSGKVYDLSKFRHEHPGGSDVLEDVAGKDGTLDFIDAGHSKDAEKMMENFQIGILPTPEKSVTDNKLLITAIGAILAGITTAYIIRRILMRFK